MNALSTVITRDARNNTTPHATLTPAVTHSVCANPERYPPGGCRGRSAPGTMGGTADDDAAPHPVVGVDTDRERARTQQLEMLEALQVAIARRVEVTEAVVSAEDQIDAVQRLRGLLGVSEVGAVHILNMEWRLFTRSERRALQDRMTDLSNRA
jgi:hypothetical protein